MPIGANKRFSKVLFPGKWTSFWKIKVHQRLWYTMGKLISELAPGLTHNCKSYRLNISWDRPFYASWTFLGRCMTEVCCQIVTQLFNKSLNVLKTYPSLGRTSRNILAPEVKDLILMAQDYILRVRESYQNFR